jgi:hypothetical protein
MVVRERAPESAMYGGCRCETDPVLARVLSFSMSVYTFSSSELVGAWLIFEVLRRLRPKRCITNSVP